MFLKAILQYDICQLFFISKQSKLGMYKGSMISFALKTQKMTFSDFFGTLSYKIKAFSVCLSIWVFAFYVHEKIIVTALC